MGKYIVKPIGQLERLDIAQSVPNMGVHDQFRQPENLSAEMESISEARLLSLLGCQCLHRLQIEIVVQMQIVEVLPVDQKVKHVVALPADLHARLDPIELGVLEELRALEGLEEAALLLRFGTLSVEAVEDPAFEQLLVAHADLDRIPLRALLSEPLGDQWNIVAPPGRP
jgi:hypothetical protein